MRIAEQETAALDELKEIIHKTIRVRRVTLAIFLIIATVIRLFLGVSFAIPLLAAPLAWFALTFPFKYLMDRQQDVQRLHKVHTSFFTLELILITYLIHLLEGVEWIGVIFYLFTVIYANFFLPKAYSRLITAMAITLYGVLVFLEYFGLLPHRSLFAQQGYQDSSYVVVSFLAGAVGVYTTLAYTIQIFVDLLRARQQELRRLSLKMFAAREEERRQIGQKLHDEIGQTLMVAKMDLEMLKGSQASQSAELLGEAIEAIRDLSQDLRPPLLEELGLGPALQGLCEKFEKATGITVRLRQQGLSLSDQKFPESLAAFIYRAAQEALTNVARHAGAKKADVSLACEGRKVRLEICDDGRGFSPEEHPPSMGLGLLGMREQARLLGGSFHMISKPGQGTTLRLELPIDYDQSIDRG